MTNTLRCLRCGAILMTDEIDEIELLIDEEHICWDCKIQKGGLY